MATAISFDEIEKIIQEKLFYKVLFTEYYRNKDIIGTGFRMTKYDFIINMVVVRAFPVAKILELAEKISEKYNIFVHNNIRTEKPRWSLDYPTPYTYSYSFYITSEHDESILEDENFQRILLK